MEPEKDTLKELKVRIAVADHLRLHTLKILRGQSISDTVQIALKRYFEDDGRFQA